MSSLPNPNPEYDQYPSWRSIDYTGDPKALLMTFQYYPIHVNNPTLTTVHLVVQVTYNDGTKETEWVTLSKMWAYFYIPPDKSVFNIRIDSQSGAASLGNFYVSHFLLN